jgi:hypothetical protein
MSDIPEHIQIKLQNAADYIPKIMKVCLREATHSRARQRKRISVYLGEMTPALRAALNYAMWDFAENNLKPLLSENEYKKIRWSHDFPIEKNKEAFDKSRSRILRHIADDLPDVYRFLEKTQSYHSGNNYLWYLKVICNDTAHTIPIEAQVVNANDVAFIGFKPRVLGNQVVVASPDGSYRRVYSSIPCYVQEPKMFVSRQKKWVLFLIGLEDEAKPNLVPFIETANREVGQLISEFYTLW